MFCRAENDVGSMKMSWNVIAFRTTVSLWGAYIGHGMMPLTRGQWWWDFMFTLLLAWASCWTNNRFASNVRRHDIPVTIRDTRNDFRATGEKYLLARQILQSLYKVLDRHYPKSIYPTQSYHDYTPTQENGQRPFPIYKALDRHYLKSIYPTHSYYDLTPIGENRRHPIRVEEILPPACTLRVVNG